MEKTFEKELYLINNLNNMQVVDINTGKIIGFICDMVVDCDDYRIKSIVIPTERKTWFKKGEYIKIPWERIHKIGIDVILVSLNCEEYEESLKCTDIVLNNE
ncbi:sporulation protein, YlmC/YmxH family [Hathewaya proteolytica DSM 3090]|uniref:Sporulation protein, YlmC/YmxH family n=1 Tax=Hathewaya proteolytica DSM 3090 TaxID=1121331 RepID=A0A1M6JBY6_9CLOT|nr:YlmC/YmxH family sporulation protein [Hathewaya proteolytica]SHJ44201.1 sporulation protein, YlmC/YmxH family [Hathewaya proteolytica DSM 3090]